MKRNDITFDYLAGKTIVSATQKKLPDYDDEGFLVLTFSDGTRVAIIGGYGGYTGDSKDEYITQIEISDDEEFINSLVDVE